MELNQLYIFHFKNLKNVLFSLIKIIMVKTFNFIFIISKQLSIAKNLFYSFYYESFYYFN